MIHLLFKVFLMRLNMNKIAIVGVNNSLGREILNILEENGISADSIFAVDTNSPLGTQVSYGEDVDMDVWNLDDFEFFIYQPFYEPFQKTVREENKGFAAISQTGGIYQGGIGRACEDDADHRQGRVVQL